MANLPSPEGTENSQTPSFEQFVNQVARTEELRRSLSERLGLTIEGLDKWALDHRKEFRPWEIPTFNENEWPNKEEAKQMQKEGRILAITQPSVYKSDRGFLLVERTNDSGLLIARASVVPDFSTSKGVETLYSSPNITEEILIQKIPGVNLHWGNMPSEERQLYYKNGLVKYWPSGSQMRYIDGYIRGDADAPNVFGHDTTIIIPKNTHKYGEGGKAADPIAAAESFSAELRGSTLVSAGKWAIRIAPAT